MRIQQIFIGNLNDDTFLPFSTDGKLNLFAEKHVVDQYNVFVQDEWKARSNLTFNLGVRWELNPPGTYAQ